MGAQFAASVNTVSKIRCLECRWAMIPSVVAFGGGHNYHDCPTNTQYDSRWLTKTSGGLPVSGIISSETGNMDTTVAGEPHWGARCIAAMNHGTIMEVAHIGPSTSTDNSQTLVNSAGTPSGAQLQARVIFGRAAERRHHDPTRLASSGWCTAATAAPRAWSLDTTFADRMIRTTATAFPGSTQPAACDPTDAGPSSAATRPSTATYFNPVLRRPLRRPDDPGHRDDPGSGGRRRSDLVGTPVQQKWRALKPDRQPARRPDPIHPRSR